MTYLTCLGFRSKVKFKVKLSDHPTTMKYTSIQLVGAGRIKSQRFDFDHEDDDAYEWSVDERERELAKAVSLKLKIPAQFLTLEFNSSFTAPKSCWSVRGDL